MQNFEVDDVILVPFCRYHDNPLLNIDSLMSTCTHCSHLHNEEFVVFHSTKYDYKARKVNDESLTWRFMQPSNPAFVSSLNMFAPTCKAKKSSFKRSYIDGAKTIIKLGKNDHFPSDLLNEEKQKAISWIKRNCREWPYNHSLGVEIIRDESEAHLNWYFQKKEE